MFMHCQYSGLMITRSDCAFDIFEVFLFTVVYNRAGHMESPVLTSGLPTGGRGQLGHFSPGPSLKRAPGGPMKGPLNTCLKYRYTLIEQSDLNTLIEQSQYSSEEQYSKLIDKEIWLVMGSYCHCQQVVTFFFFFFFFFLVFTLQLGSRAPL